MAVVTARSLLVFCAIAFAALGSVWAELKRRHEARGVDLKLWSQLTEAKRRLEQDRARSALSLARAVAAGARRRGLAHAAWHVVAWAELELGRPRDARWALARVPLGARDAYAVAAVELALGHGAYALEVLEQARAVAPLHASAAKLLIDCHARLGDFAQACAVAESALAELTPAETRSVIAAACARNCHAAALRLAAALCERTGSPEDALETRSAANLAETDGAS